LVPPTEDVTEASRTVHIIRSNIVGAMWTDLQHFFDFEQRTRVNKEQFQFIKINQTSNVESKPNRKPACRAKKKHLR
jgi:hypothetical protein